MIGAQLNEILRRLDRQGKLAKTRFQAMEDFMTDLNTALADLTTAVQGVADRIGQPTADLKAALATAQEALAAMTAEDQADQAALDQANADLATALSQAQTAADTIETSVAALNAIDAVTPPPVDEPTPTPEQPADPTPTPEEPAPAPEQPADPIPAPDPTPAPEEPTPAPEPAPNSGEGDGTAVGPEVTDPTL